MRAKSAISSTCSITIHSGNNGLALSVDGDIKVATANSTWIDVLLMQAMLDEISRLNKNLLIVHAAAIGNTAGEALIFAAPSGSGKSTIATQLSLDGHHYLGDDLVLLDPLNKTIVPFPTAPNLKPGSWPLFETALPAMLEQSVFRTDIRPVKFAPLPSEQARQAAYPVKALIFPQYNDNAAANIKALSLKDSMTYLSEIRRNTSNDNLVEASLQLIQFTQDTPCFALSYKEVDTLHEITSELGL